MATYDLEGTLQIAVSLAASASLRISAAGVVPSVFLAEGNIIAAPRVASAVTRSHIKIRVTFDQPMTNDSRLTSPSNYKLTPATDGVPLFVQSVTPEAVTNPTYVDLVTNEMTDGQGYTVQVTSGAPGPVSRLGIAMNALGAVGSFVGSGELPTVLRVEAVGLNRADVVFSEPMLDNAAIRNPAKYVFSGGLLVLGVLDVDVDTVKLITSDQTPGAFYNLTIG
ncbi:MAG: hypothetical protein ACWGQW_01370 [bacterium]